MFYVIICTKEILLCRLNIKVPFLDYVLEDKQLILKAYVL